MSPDDRTSPAAASRIFVVSGDPILRERLYDLLARHQYSVKTLVSGRLAAEALTHEQPHLIIANSSANDCPGASFPDWIRRFNESLPIIMLGHPGEEPPDSRTARDIQAYLRSDVSDAELLDAVDRWLTHSRANEPGGYIGYPGTILAIDDELEYLQAIEEFLSPRRCQVVTARSGEEGLQKLAQCSPTLVLLDVKMSGMDGLVALKKIKELRPNLPVIMMTAVEDKHLMAQAYALGAFEYIVKPYDLKSLKSILSYIKAAQDNS